MRSSPRFKTDTVTRDGQLVPWLAAEGPLAYSPENPPSRDYFFQYGWILPGIFAERTSPRRHYYFGASLREHARELFSFWEAARKGKLERVAFLAGYIDSETITAPIAVYRAMQFSGGPAYVLIQHGSYQIVPAADQPLMAAGEVLLYRGIQRSTEFRFSRRDTGIPAQREQWMRYIDVQAYVLSDAMRSFNSIHDRAVRCETEHIRDRSWMTDDIARQHGLDIETDSFSSMLWAAAHQSFALARWVAERKFGPNYVICKTALGNIRISSFFAGEYELRIIDPGSVEILEKHGCRAVRS